MNTMYMELIIGHTCALRITFAIMCLAIFNIRMYPV